MGRLCKGLQAKVASQGLNCCQAMPVLSVVGEADLTASSGTEDAGRFVVNHWTCGATS